MAAPPEFLLAMNENSVVPHSPRTSCCVIPDFNILTGCRVVSHFFNVFYGIMADLQCYVNLY